jgi:O-antigen/teichoic acid export membrane protein
MDYKVSINKVITGLDNPLLKNSVYLIMSYLAIAGGGFFFWILAAKYYSSSEVGIATGIISSITLIVLLSRLGLDYSMIRFFPTRDKSILFNSSTIATTLFACLLGMIFLINIELLSPTLYLLKSPSNAILYLIILSANSVLFMTGVSFVAIRKAKFQLIQNIMMSTRVVFLFFFTSLGAIGILYSVGISFALSIITATYFIYIVNIKPLLKIDITFLSKAVDFSAGNYVASMFLSIPNNIFPILILNTHYAGQAAYYYIAYGMATIIFTIPTSISTSLFVEGSHGKKLSQVTFKAIKLNYLLLVPVAFFVYAYGGTILRMIGSSYAIEGLVVLRILTIAGFFVALNQIYFSVLRVQQNMKKIIIHSGLIFFVLLISGYYLLTIFGIIGIAYAWILSYGIGTIKIFNDYLRYKYYEHAVHTDT